MQIRSRGLGRVCALLLVSGSLAACTLDKQKAPGLIGPGGSAQTVTLTASPDRIAHNGTAQSVVTVTMHNEVGEPLGNQRVSIGASTGSVSHTDGVTAADGRASFIVTAPALSTPAERINVFVTPFGSNADTALTRQVGIALTGNPANTTAPTASFTFLPEAPVEGDSIVFDATGTIDEGQPCLTSCSYSWSFGGLGSGLTEGMVVSRTNLTRATYAVTLTVTDNAGTVSTRTLSVTVAPPPATAVP